MIDRLNKILKESYAELSDNKYSAIIESLLDIVLSNMIITRSTNYKLAMPTKNSIEYSIDFINSISNRYGAIARNMFSSLEYYNIIYRTDIESCVYNRNGHPKMDLFLGNTIEDSYTITHELFHCINFGFTLNRNLITETISLTAERLQQEYFKKIDIKEFQKRERNIFFEINQLAYIVDFELKLIKYYLTYKTIDNDFLSRFINSRDRRYARIIEEEIDEILGYNHLRYNYYQRYIIAIVLSSLLVNLINDNPENIKLFIGLNDNCNQFSFIESLEYLGLEVINKDIPILSNDSLNILEKEYQKRLSKL